MKKEIHPEYVDCMVVCTCGNTFQTRSVKPELHTEICSMCHPFFTGKQKMIDTAGRVERFQKRYGNWREKAAQNKQKTAEKKTVEVIAEAIAEMNDVPKMDKTPVVGESSSTE